MGETEVDALKTLPQPMHLYEYLTRSHHYHFGCFEDPKEALPAAMDRMVLQSAGYLVPGGTVLDVGCGLGGSAMLLADRGFPTFGIDPCLRAVRYAGLSLRAGRNLDFVVLNFQDLTSCFETPEQGFHNLLITEVLQYIPSLDALMGGCFSLVRPGGVIVINDVMTVPALDWARVPLHRQERVRKTAETAGMEVVDCRTITASVLPTLDRLIEALRRSERSAVSFFRDTRPGVEREIPELIHQWWQLKSGFKDGVLAYETLILRIPEGAR